MHPILFHLGPVTIHSYGVMFVLAFFSATWLAARTARQWPAALVVIPPDEMLDFTCWLLLGGILGARIFYVAQEWTFYASAPLEIVALWHGGLIWYGGFFGSAAAGWWYGRARGLAFLRMADQFIPFLAIGHAVGRIGCFLNGCCYGKPTESWCGIVFLGHREAVLPTQLFEAAGLFVVYLILRQLQRPDILRRPGLVFSMYLVLYGALRFGLEFFRGDQTIWWAGLTLQQGISIVVILAGLGFIMTHSRTAR